MFALIKQYKWLLIGGVILAVVFVWWGMPSSNTQSQTSITTTDDTSVVDPTLVQTFLTVSSIDLSGTIFTEAAFTSLQDFSTPIVDEPVGRPNPFAPLASTAAADSATNTVSRIFSAPAASSPVSKVRAAGRKPVIPSPSSQ